MKLSRVENKDIKKSKENKEKLYLNLDIVLLDLLSAYIVSSNKNIRRGHLVNIKNLIDMTIENDYINDNESLTRLNIIKHGLEARIDLSIKNIDIIKRHIKSKLYNDFDFDKLAEMSNTELEWVNKMVSDALKYAFVNASADEIIEACNNIKTAEFGRKGEYVDEFEGILNRTQNKIRRSKVSSFNEATFSLREGIFQDTIREYHEQLSNPSNKLIFGMQGLNEITNGGVENGRVYMFFGLPGEGKSTMLLNLAYQIKKYNKDYRTKDPTKTPCVVLLTMENTVKESVERLFNIATNSNKNMTNYTVEECLHMLRNEGGLYVNDTSPIDLIIKYKGAGTATTSYLYDLTDELEEDGYEVICVLQDYIKKINPANKDITEGRIQLGAISNEFKNYAVYKDIPFISASQLNRDASKHIDEARKVNKGDLVRLLGRSNIGESSLMLENIDGGFLLAPEFDPETGMKYLGTLRIKFRGKASEVELVYLPFVMDNHIKFIEDFDSMTPVYKRTMRSNTINNNVSGYHTNSIRDLDNGQSYRVDEEERNLFIQNII